MTLPIENYIIRQYVHCATRRNIPFLLESAQVVEFFDMPCHYCGATHTNTATRKQYAVKTRKYNGIDRKDSFLPYEDGNVVACCGDCNAAKSDMSYDGFMASEYLRLKKG